MADGKVAGFFVLGQNPAVGSANGRLHRFAMAELEWLVVRDLVEIETATFWRDGPEIDSGELKTADIATEVFFLPAAAHSEKDGSFTQTQRLLQWHHKSVEPQGDCRSDLWFYWHLGRIIRKKLAGSTEARDRPVLDLTWTYPLLGPTRDPDAVFVGSAAASAAGSALAFTPVADAGPARRLAVMGAALEVGACRAMESRLDEVAGPYEHGKAGRLAGGAEACSIAGALLVMAGGRRRDASAVAGGLLCAGSLLTRFSVFRAGSESAADPAATIVPQRRRAGAAGRR